jgi:lysyl-tRNA synthetase class II
MSEPMTEAEQAAAGVLCRVHNRRVDIAMELEPADFADEARAVVAAVRPILAAETLENMAIRLEEMHFVKGERAWPFVAEIRKTAAALRTTTSEENR